MMRGVTIAMGAVALVCASCDGDRTRAGHYWTQLTPATSPPRLTFPKMAHDSVRERVVVHGAAGSTWEYDGTTWIEAMPSASPPGRWAFAIAYDAARERIVLFGGAHLSVPEILADTWEYDGTTWTEATPAASPSPRTGHAMAYDETRRRLVLFGGGYSYVGFLDTWEYDGTTWTGMRSDVLPEPVVGHAMAYDAARERVVLFGGRREDTTLSCGTWEYDGTGWTEVVPDTSPPARFGHAMAYDAARARVVMFGGQGDRGDLGDTWEYDGTTWTQTADARLVVTSPAARSFHAMAFDSARERVVLFGGSDFTDTWEYIGP